MASTSGSLNAQAVNSGDLVDLVSSSASITIYPNDDAILNTLQSRFRADLPYTRLGSSNLIVVNPYKTLANVNDASAKEYQDRCYKDTSLPLVDSPKPLQPHVYELAAKLYLVMRRRHQSQSIVARGITGSGKSANCKLLVNQLLRLSAHTKKERKLAEQINAVTTVLDAFGNSKTLMNANASRHSRYLELHFNEQGRIESAQILAYGLDKSRLEKLKHEERTFHVFYQFLSGATPEERDAYNIEDPSDYALLASSGCYRLPSGPFSDDAVAMGELRAAMKILGFKAKHMASIFSLLIAILLLGNIQFADADFHDVSAQVTNKAVLQHAARFLGITPEDLETALTNRTNYVRKELFTSLLSAEQSALQRDRLVKDLYAILFAYVVETCNYRIAPAAGEEAPFTQVAVLDQPGFQSRGPASGSVSGNVQTPLVAAYGQNGFDEFCPNFTDEMMQSFVYRNSFEDNVGYNGHIVGDGVNLPPVNGMDNSACVELLRGAALGERASRKPGGVLGAIAKASSSYKSGKAGDDRDKEFRTSLVESIGVHASFVAGQDEKAFGINHYTQPVSYNVDGFVEKSTDLLDSAFVTLLRNSTDTFVAKLLSGPSLATERHFKDDDIVVQAQVSSRPLRPPTAISKESSLNPDTISEAAQLDAEKIYPVPTQLNHTLSGLFHTIEQTHMWTISCIRPNDSCSPNSFDKRRVKHQIRSMLLPDMVARKSVEYVADYDIHDFCERYVPTMQGSEADRIRQCASANGWDEGSDYRVGHRMVWLSYSSWKTVEDILRSREEPEEGDEELQGQEEKFDQNTQDTGLAPAPAYFDESRDNLLRVDTGGHTPTTPYSNSGLLSAGGDSNPGLTGSWTSGWDKKGGDVSPNEKNLVVHDVPNAVEEIPTSRARRWWLIVVWGLTGYIPSYFLRVWGRMKRPDVRMAWREKLAIFLLIFLLNGMILFYIIEFGKLICPNSDKAWLSTEVAQHTGTHDFYVSIQGVVYDVSDFVRGQHSDILSQPSNGADTLGAVAGQDLTQYFPPPLFLACQNLVTDTSLIIPAANATNIAPTAYHYSGASQPVANTSLRDANWYQNRFQKKMKEFRKGPLVWDVNDIAAQANANDTTRNWAIYNSKVFDLSDYLSAMALHIGDTKYSFLNADVVSVFKNQPGQDITNALDKVLQGLDSTTRRDNMDCLQYRFYIGDTDFRKTARCQVQNYFLLAFSILIVTSMVLKFLAALQLNGKRFPELQDKFILCQVPCYTEGEDSLRRTIDSLAGLNYDDKRKLIFIICDGNIIGSGNDRTTPRIVLDILGVDPKIDPEPLLFKSVGEGSRQLNYGKVYSGLYEFEGHVVPYMVIVKVGKPTERSKPGNRGKRDSQIMVMQYLNKVHFDSPMSPLELEIYHQMRNVIGIDPAFYEYIFTVDADTSVDKDSVNRLVAAASDDSSIIGVCGETKLANEEGSWWTMIQVYEYYISHHLSKAFESLFGSVTCLPGCFSLYRIRTADKGRPIIISNRIIEEYSEGCLDTLHKKNLFSLGEDRFLTTLMLKHFPTFKTKFVPDALAHTVAPESWRVLFSQRRRWINSTVHNLCELVFLPELFGFCCFSMRFFVFIDLLGTLILPATVVYLIYLVVVVATGTSAFPQISIILLAATYGLQAIIFILHREFMLVGWMVVYILSYPIYSFLLPVYSFWCMDEFGWGNTRLVIGEGSKKQVIMNEDEKYDESMIPLKKFSDYEAEAWEGSHHSEETGYASKPRSRLPQSQLRAESPGYQTASQTGDHYRDTNLTMNNSANPHLRINPRAPSQHTNDSYARQPSMMQQPFAPQLPFMAFGGSQYGSEHGGPVMPMHGGSVYGMMNAPRNTMMTMFGAGPGSQVGPPSLSGNARPFSTFTQLAGPSDNANPSDSDIYDAIRHYLSVQDLMTVSKKTTREAIAAQFPKADLSSRKDFMNTSIDSILSQT